MNQKLAKAIKGCSPLYRTIHRCLGTRIHEPDSSGKHLTLLGSDYGGWSLDLSALNKTSTCYSVGVGEDITFDLALIKAVGCDVHAFDPTPKAVEYMKSQQLPSELHFYAIGLGAVDEMVEFHVPPIPSFHSYSATAMSNAEQKGIVLCPVKRISTLMRELGHQDLDVLKIDIEGFEFSVIPDMLASGIKPVQLLIEFHHLIYQHTAAETKAAVRSIKDAGYDICWISDIGREYGFRLRN